MVWLCLGGQWNLALDVSPHLQTSRNHSGCRWGLQGGRSRVPGRSSTCLCFPRVWRKTFPTGYHVAQSPAACIPGYQDMIKGFCCPPGFGSCCPTLAALHHCRPGAVVTTATRPAADTWCLQAAGIPSLARNSQPIPGHVYFTAYPSESFKITFKICYFPPLF